MLRWVVCHCRLNGTQPKIFRKTINAKRSPLMLCVCGFFFNCLHWFELPCGSRLKWVSGNYLRNEGQGDGRNNVHRAHGMLTNLWLAEYARTTPGERVLHVTSGSRDLWGEVFQPWLWGSPWRSVSALPFGCSPWRIVSALDWGGGVSPWRIVSALALNVSLIKCFSPGYVFTRSWLRILALRLVHKCLFF